MKKTKLFKKIIIAGVLLSAGITALTCLNSQTVAAKSLPVATTKDYNKLQKLSKKSGVHYIKKRKWYASFIPGDNVEAYRDLKSLKLIGTKSDPGIDDWDVFVGAGTINGTRYFISNIKEKDGKRKYIIPAAYCQVPYGYQLKKGHAVVHDYNGSLANAYNGYSESDHKYGKTLTNENIIYSNKEDATFTVSLKQDGQTKGKHKGFWIGRTPIKFRVDGTNTYENYYPLYNYVPNGELIVTYIKTEDLSQFKPATVTYNHIGTITKNHKFKPAHKKLNI